MSELKFNPFPKLSTERLVLRTLSPSDDKEIYLLRSDSKVNKYLDRPPNKSIEDARAFIEKINSGIKNNEWIFWAVAKQNEEKLIGTICLWNFSEDKRTAEVGFELLPNFQGHGFINEALGEIIEYSFSEIKLEKIEGYTNLENIQSIKVMERYDFIRDKVIDEKHSVTDEPIQTVIYKLEKDY